MDVKISPWVFPFLYSDSFIKIMFFAPLLLIFCDAPFIDQSQPYVIYRSGRVVWGIGQLLYVTLTSALYFAFLLLISNLFLINHLEFSLEWGKAIGTLGNTGAAQAMGLEVFMDSRVLFYFTPLQATWFTFLLSWLAGTFLGFLIYALNSLTNTRSLGVLLAASFLILNSTVEDYPAMIWLSPVSWSDLHLIDIGGYSAYPPIAYVYGAFFVVMGVLVTLSIIANRRQEIQVMQPV
jgi:hypothetical protein